MNLEDRLRLILTGIVIGGLLILILGIVALCRYHKRRMAAMGYEETLVLGSTTTTWQRRP